MIPLCLETNEREETEIPESKEIKVNISIHPKIVIEDSSDDEVIYIETKKKKVCRCKFIKKNGKRCRQTGKKSQSDGKIINGYCSYHR